MQMTYQQTKVLDCGKVEIHLQQYKTMTVPVYYGFTTTGHCIGYSQNYRSIVKRLEKEQNGGWIILNRKTNSFGDLEVTVLNTKSKEEKHWLYHEGDHSSFESDFKALKRGKK
jgi:hypothetical protein